MKKQIITMALVMLGVASWATDYTMIVTKNDNSTAQFTVSEVKNVTFKEKTDNNKMVQVKDGTYVTFVDLGLPSGTLWADRNVGAESETAYGSYFAWGETVATKSDYSWATYMNAGMTSYRDCGGTKDVIYQELGSNADIAGTKYDAATANWGEGYKMPTQAQCQELIDNCTWTWTTKNGVDGYEVTSKADGNTNSIFLPAAGFRYGTDIGNVGSYGYCWSSSLKSDNLSLAWYLSFDSGNRKMYFNYRYYGQSVRPVSE